MLIRLFHLPVLLLSGSCLAGFGFGPEVRIDTHSDPLTGDVDVIRLPSGRFVVVWEGSELPSQDLLVFCSYSDDFGATWSDNIPVGDGSEIVPQYSRLACDSTGTLYCVWEDWRGPEAYAVYFSRSDDGGETWLTPSIRVSNEGKAVTAPGIAVNGDGSAILLLFSYFSPHRIYSSYSTDGGYTWSPDTPVGDYPYTGNQYYPVVESVGGNTFVSLWNDVRDTESFIYSSLSEDNGQTWLQPNLPVPCGENQDLGSRSIRMHWDGSVLHSTWIEEIDYYIENVYYSRSEDNGYSWLEEPVQVNYDTPNTKRRYGGVWARNPAEIFVTWDSIWNSSRPTYAVCAYSSDSGKTWSDTLRANPVSGESDRCDIFGDVDSGEVLLAWSNQVNGYIMCNHGCDTSGFESETLLPNIQSSMNPFTGAVSFTVTGDVLPEALKVYDSAGREIQTLHSFSPGIFAWTPSPSVVPGIYFARGLAEGRTLTARVVLLE